MKIRVRDQGWQTMLLRQLNGRKATLLVDVETRGGVNAKAGTVVTIRSSSSATVWLNAPHCEHCGVAFGVRTTSVELVKMVEILPPEDES